MSVALPEALKKLEVTRAESSLFARPWTCTAFGSRAEIDVFFEERGRWETVAEVRDAAGMDAEEIAVLIVNVANSYRGKYLRQA